MKNEKLKNGVDSTGVGCGTYASSIDTHVGLVTILRVTA